MGVTNTSKVSVHLSRDNHYLVVSEISLHSPRVWSDRTPISNDSPISHSWWSLIGAILELCLKSYQSHLLIDSNNSGEHRDEYMQTIKQIFIQLYAKIDIIINILLIN